MNYPKIFLEVIITIKFFMLFYDTKQALQSYDI